VRTRQKDRPDDEMRDSSFGPAEDDDDDVERASDKCFGAPFGEQEHERTFDRIDGETRLRRWASALSRVRSLDERQHDQSDICECLS
jgi:hypothetical protein